MMVGILLRKDLRRDLKHPKILLILFVLVGTVLIFGVTEFLHRYIILGLPFLYIFFFWCFSSFLREKPVKEQLVILVAVSSVLSFLFFLQWDNHQQINNWHFPPLEQNLEYQDIISTGKEMAEFVEKYYSDAVVWTGFPTNYMLSESFQHYVSKEIETHNCQKYKEGDKVDLIVFHLFSPSQIDCLKMLQSLNFSPLIRFEKNGKWIEIYKNNDYKP